MEIGRLQYPIAINAVVSSYESSVEHPRPVASFLSVGHTDFAVVGRHWLLVARRCFELHDDGDAPH